MLTRQFFEAESIDASLRCLHTSLNMNFTAQPWVDLHWQSRNEKTSIPGWYAQPGFSVQKSRGRRTAPGAYAGYCNKSPPDIFGWEIQPDSAVMAAKENLDLIRAWHAGLGYSWLISPEWMIRSEIFWQHQDGVGIDGNVSSTFSVFNENDYRVYPNQAVTYHGSGQNRGMEISAEHHLSNGWFVLANLSVFKSKYRGSDRIWRPARWDTRHIANLTAGKE